MATKINDDNINSRAKAISAALRAHDKAEGLYKDKVRPHLIIIEDADDRKLGKKVGCAACGRPSEVIAMLLSLVLQVAKSMEDTELDQLKDPQVLLELLSDMCEKNESEGLIKDEDKEEQ